MKVSEVTTVDEMSVSTGGLNYEGRVLASVRQTIPKFKKYIEMDDDHSTAGFSNVGVDLELLVAGKPFHVEIKMNTKAQMGGTSMLIDLENDTMRLKNPEDADPELQELFFAGTRAKLDDFRRVLAFFKKNSPPAMRKKLKNAIPCGAVPAEVWDKAIAAGYMQRLAVKVPLKDVNWVANHYNKKGVYYIQIGGAGLFYLNTNPLNLPIPKFESPLIIEMEFRRGGGATKTGKSSGGYRVQGRLQAKNIKSTMTLDDPLHVAEVFKTIINNANPAAKKTAKAADTKTPAVAKPKFDAKEKAKLALATGGQAKKGSIATTPQNTI
jgi:hypothetical protein